MKKIIILFFLTTFSLNSQILSEKNRAVKINEILKNRFENVLPELMDKTGIDMWILISAVLSSNNAYYCSINDI